MRKVSAMILAGLFCLAGTGCGEVKEEQNALLFEGAREGVYTYAPSVLQVSDNERYVYYCTSPGEERIVDLIGCRKGTRTKKGWEYGEEEIVLERTVNAWDSMHVCDPTVVKGEFRYRGEEYSYLMSYLGCATGNNQENEMGMAVSNDPMSGWIKCDDINPIVPFVRDTSPEHDNLFQWGFGQASMINMDKKGRILMFYSEGRATRTLERVDLWNFEDLDNPVRIFTAEVSEEGLTDSYGAADFLNSADFMYDPDAGRFYAVSPCHPVPADSNPTNISDRSRVTYLEFGRENASPEVLFRDPEGWEWKTLAVFGKNETGFDFQHNAGFVRDAYGWNVRPDGVEVIYTSGTKVPEDPLRMIWNYRLHRYEFLTEGN